jgi:hypothetical protein
MKKVERPSPKKIRKAFGEHLTVNVDGYEQTVWDIMKWGGLDLAIDFLQEHVHKGEGVGVVSDYEHMSELGVEESIRLNAFKE